MLEGFIKTVSLCSTLCLSKYSTKLGELLSKTNSISCLFFAPITLSNSCIFIDFDIIIFDICFAATADATVPKAYEGGIKSEVAKLLNVAMTRAETFFILIGDTEGIKSMKEEFLLKDWISEIEQL